MASNRSCENSAHSPAPWTLDPPITAAVVTDTYHIIEAGRGYCGEGFTVTGHMSLADAQLMTAAPELVDGVNALLGLLQLVCNRDDLPPSIKAALTDSHRIEEAKAALAKAGVA